MHILAILAALVGGIGIWWFRARRASEVADAVADAAGHLRGGFRRRKRAAQIEFAPITSIDNPAVAAATLLHFVAGRDGWTRAHPEVTAALTEVVSAREAKEAVTYAEWAFRQVLTEDKAIDTLAEKLRGWLDETETAKLAAMIDRLGDDVDLSARDRARAKLMAPRVAAPASAWHAAG